MVDSLLLSTGPTEFDVLKTLLTAIGLLLPTLVFLVGIYRSENKVNGWLGDIIKRDAPSFGTTLGLQGISFGIFSIISYLFYVLTTVLLPSKIAISLPIVLGISFLSALSMVVILFLMVWGLAGTKDRDSEVEKLNDDVDRTVLQQRNQQLKDSLDELKNDIGELTTNFKRLDMMLKRQDVFDEEFIQRYQETFDEDIAESFFGPDSTNENKIENTNQQSGDENRQMDRNKEEEFE